MNSFNHYAYGSFAGWVFEEAAGIKPLKPGFSDLLIEPKPDLRLGWLRAEYISASGKIVSSWMCEGNRVRYEITVPTTAQIHIDDAAFHVNAGSYLFWGNGNKR